MSAALGSGGTLEYGPDGSSWTLVHKLVSVDMSPTADMIEVTSNDSNGSKEYLTGNSDHVLSFKCVYDSSDTGQQAIITAFYAGTTYYYRARARVASGENQQIGIGKIKSIKFPAQNNQKVELDVTVQMTGAITRSAQ